MIKLENVNFIYQQGTPFEFNALKNVSLTINKGELAGIIGPTGSGKSTLIQHFNGLLAPTGGRVIVEGIDINKRQKKKNKTANGVFNICFDVGLVFQYPEYQLFEETVFDDVAFGPRNMELEEDEVGKRVKNAMAWLGLDFETMKDRSPFSLSGGEMRRAALAGVLAMQPKVLVLDEPTAGLDPRGREELMQLIHRFHDELDMTLVMVTHEMGEITRIVDHLIVLNNGEIAADGAPADIFKRKEWIREIGLGLPPFMELMERLNKRGFKVRSDVLGIEDAVKELLILLKDVS